MTKDFQEILNHAGLPGFCATEERNQLKIQRLLTSNGTIDINALSGTVVPSV